MRKVTSVILIAVLLISSTGMTGCMRARKRWYKATLQYYSDGVNNGFTKEYSNLYVPDELKNKYIKSGYLLYDLDGDGIEELLIGMIDDGNYTKFTNVIINRRGSGPDCVISGTNGYYVYLCAGNVLRVDSPRGSSTEKEYLKYDSKNNSFPVIDGEGKYLPMKWELTEF